MNDRGKSDSRVVPAKLANKTGQPVAELVEERRLTKGNTGQQNVLRTQGRDIDASSALERVRRVARKDKGARFTALLHHVDLSRVWAAYAAISPKAAPGVDQVTWAAYGQNLRGNLEDLLRRVHSGAYRASPSRRVYIPKPDGRQRALGIADLGGQDRPTGGGRGAECHLRGGLPWLLIRVPAGAQAPRRTRCAGGRDRKRGR